MNIALWITQGVLAAMFGMAGVMKSLRPKDQLKEQLPWVEDFGSSTVKFIGVSELLGALGLILPAALGIAEVLTPIAATALALVMVLAALTHARRREPGAIVFNLVLLAAAAFVAWGRFGPESLG